jgi:hypothetical protein
MTVRVQLVPSYNAHQRVNGSGGAGFFHLSSLSIDPQINNTAATAASPNQTFEVNVTPKPTRKSMHTTKYEFIGVPE